jgi:hypothetical protein
MCTVSAIGDNWQKRLPEAWPWVQPYIDPLPQGPAKDLLPWMLNNGPTREEFEALKKEVLELKELLKAAQKFDAATNQPHCEHEDKVDLIKKIAKLVGVDLGDALA